MKTRTILAMIFMTVGLMSCTTDARTLRDDTTQDVRWYSREFKVTSWTKVFDADGLNGYYKADVNISDIRYSVIRGGQVNCYLYVDKNAQTQLPSVRHYENARGQQWTRTIDYDFYEGGVTIYVTDSDFAGQTPGAMDFRIMLSW